MNFSLFKLLLSSFVFVCFMISWYQGELIPAWQAAIWVLAVLLDDLYEYLTSTVLE